MNDEPRSQRVLRRGPKGVSLVGDTYGYTARPNELQASKIARQFGYGRELAEAIAALAFYSPDSWQVRS